MQNFQTENPRSDRPQRREGLILSRIILYDVDMLYSRRPMGLTLPAHLQDVGRGILVVRTDPLLYQYTLVVLAA